MVSSLVELLSATQDFFDHYWNPINGKAPEWSDILWKFDGTIPYNENGGCYALFHNDEIIYIGVGISEGYGKYENCGLGHRLNRYWQKNLTADKNRKYMPKSDWSELTGIRTIGFDRKDEFIALALEAFLISKLKPKRNLIHKRNNNGG